MHRSVLAILLTIINCISQAAVPDDAIQRCLNVRRLVDITSKQKMAAKEPGVLRFKFHKVPASELPLTNSVGTMDEVIHALHQQIDNCKKYPGEFRKITIAERRITRKEWCLQTNQHMLTLAHAANGDFKKFLATIKNEFDWYKSDGWPENHGGFKKGAFQFTAYYAPASVEARSKRGGKFIYPLYGNPGVVNAVKESKKLHLKMPLCGVDPVTKIERGFCLKHADGTYSIVPDRQEIAHQALHPKYIIAYVANPNDPAFLMLQGSGSLTLDGKFVHINYDGANGRPRTMLGRIIQCAQDPTCGGNLDTMERCAKDPQCHDEAKLHCNISKAIRLSSASEKLIRQYLDNPANAHMAENLRHRDQSYVFFAKDFGGPYGSENMSLTPHASCATDHRVIPLGMSFIYNVRNVTAWCIAQDAGGAIVGAHVDVYKGEGLKAGVEANALNNSGTLYIAVPKQAKK